MYNRIVERQREFQNEIERIKKGNENLKGQMIEREKVIANLLVEKERLDALIIPELVHRLQGV